MFPNETPQINGIIILPLDKTGTATSNLVINELHPITSLNSPGHFLLIPQLSPFFLNNLVLEYDNGTTISTLTLGIDYAPALLDTVSSMDCGIPIYKAISIFDTNRNGTIAITYQSMGGVRVANTPDIMAAIAGYRNNRIVSWPGVYNLPYGFNPSAHTENIANIFGQEQLIASIANFNNAIFNEPVRQLYIAAYINLTPGAASSPVINPPPTAPGIAIFMGGQYLNSTYAYLNNVTIYTFATSVMVSGSNLLATVVFGACVGNGSHATYCGGMSYTPYSTIYQTTSNYTYATNTVAAGSNLTANINQGYTIGTSNSTIGIVTGIRSWYTDLIIYASGVIIAGSTLSYPPYITCAAGTSTDAMFMNGNIAGGANSVYSYNYASNVSAIMAVNLFYYYNSASVAGNLNMAIINTNGSVSNNGTYLINYAAQTTITTTSLMAMAYELVGASSSTTAIFTGNNGYNGNGNGINASFLYTYASNVVTTTTLLNYQAGGIAGTAPNSGVNY